jgi:hypothetical protein
MGKIIGGAVLFLIGFATVGDPEAPAIWTGGMIVGVMLMVGGIKGVVRTRRVTGELKRLEARERDLTARITNGEPMDRIAADYYADHGIPPTRTLMIAASKVRELARSHRQSDRDLVHRLVSRQHVDSVTPPSEYLSTLAFERTVFYVEEGVKAHRVHPSAGRSIEGVLILSKAYLYFITNEKSSMLGKVGGRAVDKAADVVPYFGIITGGFTLMSGLSDELRNYFRAGNLANLQARFSSPDSFAIALARITSAHEMTHKGKITTTSLLEVEVSAGAHAVGRTYWFETDKFSEARWVAEWMERLELACVGEGSILSASRLVLPT